VSKSWVSDWRAYMQTRYPLAVFGPLALALCLAAGAAGHKSIWGSLLLAWLLVLQFRLEDDLFDRACDAHEHPERVLVHTAHIGSFLVLLLGLGIVNVLFVRLRGPLQLSVYLALSLAFAMWYSLRKALGMPALLHAHALPLKYAAFVFLIRPPELGPPTWLALGMVYLAFCIYEGVHDRQLRALRGIRLVLGFETAALAGLAIAALLGEWGTAA
jgi:hypothetical protein